MRRRHLGWLIPVLLMVSLSLEAQEPVAVTDTFSLLMAADAAGAKAARRASVAVPVVASAAATLLLSPYIGGIGSIIAVSAWPAQPSTMPQSVPEAAHPSYQQAYREAYRHAYRRRARRAVLTSVALTGVVWFTWVLVMGG